MDSLTLTTHECNLQLWLSRISECKASGKTVSEWCRLKGIGIKSYYYWMRKIKHEAFDALPQGLKCRSSHDTIRKTSFAELPARTAETKSSTAVILHISGTDLEIKNGADPATIKNVIHILGELC